DAEPRRDEFWRPLHQAALWQYVSPGERELAEATIVTMTHRQQVNASWRIEAAQTLMWALDLVPDLPAYDAAANIALLKRIPCKDMPLFVSSARLRKELQIDRARDDAEVWHWRSRTRQLIEEGRQFPATEKSKARGISSYDDIVRFTARML